MLRTTNKTYNEWQDMNTKRGWIGSLLVACGVTILALSFLSLYRLESKIYASDHLLINSNSYQVLPFFHAQTEDLKQVEVVVTQGPFGCYSTWGNTSWLTHPFEIALLNLGAGQTSSTTTDSTGLSAGPVTHVFDFPNGWTSLDGVRISNPENNPVAVTVTAIFHRQVIDDLWQGILYLGLSLSGIGAAIVGFAVYKVRRDLVPESKPQGI
jgi:hypothetical protein